VSPSVAGAAPSVVVVLGVAESNKINATHYTHMPYDCYSVEIAYFAKHNGSKITIMKRDMG